MTMTDEHPALGRATPAPSAREVINDAIEAGLLDDLMGRIDDGTLQLTGEGASSPR